MVWADFCMSFFGCIHNDVKSISVVCKIFFSVYLFCSFSKNYLMCCIKWHCKWCCCFCSFFCRRTNLYFFILREKKSIKIILLTFLFFIFIKLFFWKILFKVFFKGFFKDFYKLTCIFIIYIVLYNFVSITDNKHIYLFWTNLD